MVLCHIATTERKQAQRYTELVVFTGGGTAGHVFPGLAVLEELVLRVPVATAWIGGTDGMERTIVESRGIDYYAIPTGKLRRYFSFRNIPDLFRVAGGCIRSLKVLKSTRPAVVFSKGGFVSVPPVIAAWLRRIPVITHESDLDPGLATRINSRFARLVLVPYAESVGHFPESIRSRVRVVGNPIRRDITRGSMERGRQFLGFARGDPRPVVLFLGGSQGARQINELVDAARDRIGTQWLIAHQTGTERSSAEGYRAEPFFGDELPDVLAAADVLVCRAGASTLWEGAILGKPMLLVPLQSGSRGDQLRNARMFSEKGGARLFTNPDTLGDEIRRALTELVDPDRREEMGTRARALVRSDTTERIVDAICEYIDTQDSTEGNTQSSVVDGGGD
jgi:UDP-N-acetylglucosamine--N-acetylmuramyl-(pentapeptide) pyrophosphoryl-undecaprenol N-acetylglucosamine transferase